MTIAAKKKPARSGGKLRQWIKKTLHGTYDHYTCFLPEDIGRLSSLILKLFYCGILVDDTQTGILKQLEKNAIVVYVTKFKNFFEYLFFYSRYRQKRRS